MRVVSSRFLVLLLGALGVGIVARVEIDRSAALYALSTQVEIAANQAEINTMLAEEFRREIERRENRCFHWGGEIDK